MINVKLVVFVILLCIQITSAEYSDYCGICANHTLCKYFKLGPGSACHGYDPSAHLTRRDLVVLVDRINEHRNFVALGHSKLPQAANMKKISWSEDLATSAQRWADQCDPATRPDRRDLCRDLKNVAVGQNIATVFGPSPGLGVKSFIDIWYMQTLDYAGSVSYYNNSKDRHSDQFTQLIWAETGAVGCAKVKFNIERGNVTVERLVCNFAPRGNYDGKPVYAVGFPATQCTDDLIADTKYIGLCTYNQNKETKLPLKTRPIPSLLRILHLSNNSIKQEIDPVKNDLRQTISKGRLNERNQKIRHVLNNSFVANIPPYLPRAPPQSNVYNDTRRLGHPSFERGHDRVQHSHDYGHTSPSQLAIQEFRRYDFTPPTPPNFNNNFRRFNNGNQCTRGQPSPGCNDPLPCVTNKCTRGQRSGCLGTPPCYISPSIVHVTPHNMCPCTQSTPNLCTPCIKCRDAPCPNTCTTASHCCTSSCPNHPPTSCCPKIARKYDIMHETIDPRRGNTEFHYYDIFPNLAIRSGDSTSDNPQNEGKLERKIALLSTKNNNIPTQISMYRQKDVKNEQLKNSFVKRKYSSPDHYLYDTFDTSERFKRQNKALKSKSQRYTTMYNKIKSAKSSVTEPITFHIKENFGKPVSEKYLSFDELMHLRNRNVGDSNARRMKAALRDDTPSTTTTETIPETTTEDPAETTTATPTYYTVSPPLLQSIKYCTRKITCTWTMPTITGSDGKVINGGGAGGGRGDGIFINGQHRTPEGYVEGCTRTFTCTRQYMNKNKLPTTEAHSDETLEPIPDEDYCEKRALDVRPEPIEDEEIDKNVREHKFQTKSYMDMDEGSIMAPENESDVLAKRNVIQRHKEVTVTYGDGKKSRSKRQSRHNLLRHVCNNQCNNVKRREYKNPSISYGDLYYLLVNKVITSLIGNHSSHHNNFKKCVCNLSAAVHTNASCAIILFTITINIMTY